MPRRNTCTETETLTAVAGAARLRQTADLERMRTISAARAAGHSLRAIAAAAGLSEPRIHQMLAAEPTH
ncbi:hypothetical protein [Cellulomonas uda]|nr:hypothetical protein [Cellulomonas uda]NII66077.1 hypothetical protein [Cellulomonas uda]